MILYGFGTIISVILLIIAQYIHNKKNNLIFEILLIILSFFPLSLISGLRCGIGTDYYYTYYPKFNYILSGSYNFPREPLFYYLNRFIQLFTTDPKWLFIVTSFMFTTFLTISTLRMSKNWSISVLVILLGNYYFVSMNNVRQALAVSIASLALSYACDKKIIRTIIFAALSVAFHKSALVLIPVYILCMIKNIEKYGLYIIGSLLLLTPLYITLIRYGADKLEYNAYFELADSKPLYVYIMIYGIIFVFLLIYYKKLIKISNYSFGLLLVFTFGIIFSLLSSELTLESTLRMTYLFTWPLIFLIPSFTKISDNKYISYSITLLLVSFISVIMIYATIYEGWNEILPYVDIWGHVIY